MGKTLKDGIEQLRAIGGWIDGRPPTFREQMIERYGSWEEYEREEGVAAPWPDYAGNAVHEGDTIRHPSGEQGVVVLLPDEAEPEDQWRVDYGEGWVSRLCLQMGDKGQAVRVDGPAPDARQPMTDAELIAALRRKPYDRAAREAADRLEELTRRIEE